MSQTPELYPNTPAGEAAMKHDASEFLHGKVSCPVPSTIVGIDATSTAYQCGCAVDRREIRLCPLHAAAPELLDMAKYFMSLLQVELAVEMTGREPWWLRELRRKAEVAIAKAEGRG